MTAIVIRTDGTFRKVKNLGWLLRHRQDGIRTIVTYPVFDGQSTLEVELGSGQVFMAGFASHTVLIDWVRRFLVPWTTAETDIDRHTAKELEG